MKVLKIAVFFYLLLYVSEYLYAFEIERRREQFDSTYGHLFIPTPVALPGLGNGVLFIGNFGNIANTTTDFTAFYGVGDFTVAFAILDELFLYPELLYFSYRRAHGYDFAVQQYRLRGMNTKKEDFYYGVGKFWDWNNPELKLTFDERKYEFGLGTSKQVGRFNKFVAPDPDDTSKQGTTITEFDSPYERVLADQIQFSATIDYTDDYRDPRIGIRYQLFFDKQSASSISEPSFDVITNELQYYVPLLKKSTLVFDITLSDAYVSNEGETNLETLKQENNYYLCDYTSSPDTCKATTLSSAVTVQNFNKNGNSLPLGGPDRLRAYPQGRFQGAHTFYFASEFRWNFSSADQQISYFVIEEGIDELQAAFFYEVGSISETKDKLGEYTRSSVGTGFRLVTDSGNIYRGDLATGDEGTEFTLIFQYPWFFRF